MAFLVRQLSRSIPAITHLQRSCSSPPHLQRSCSSPPHLQLQRDMSSFPPWKRDTPKKLTKEQLDFLKTIKVEFQVDEKKSFTIELNPEIVKKIQAAGKEAAPVADAADDGFPSWGLICGIFVLPLPIWFVLFILWAASVFVAYLGGYLVYFIRDG